MSAETDKRCGTCKWFSSTGDRAIGDCAVNLPNSLIDPYQEMMSPHEGTDCPCWEPKQSGCSLAEIAAANGLTAEQLTAKMMQHLELIIDSPEGQLLVATCEVRPKQ